MKTNAGVKKFLRMAFVLILFSACESRQRERNEELERVRVIATQLSSEKGAEIRGEREAMQAEMTGTLNEIDRRLDLIRDQRGLLILGPRSNADDSHISTKEQILNNIAMMDELLADNSKKIKSLQARLRKANGNDRELREQLALYSQKNSEAEQAIAALKAELLSEKEKNELLTKEIGDRNTAYAELQQRYNKVEDEAYSVYYAVGTRSELKKMQITERRSPFTLVSRELSPGASTAKFKKADMRSTPAIPVKAKKAHLVTEHPEGSYAWEKLPDGTKNLKITDPSAFWKTSKYLVIEIRG